MTAVQITSSVLGTATQFITAPNGYLYMLDAYSGLSLRIFKSTTNGASWSELTAVTLTTLFGNTSSDLAHISADIDSAGYIHVAAVAATWTSTTRDIVHSRLNTSTDAWDTWAAIKTNVSSTPSKTPRIALAMDANDKPHVIFDDENNDVYYSNKVSGSWLSPELVKDETSPVAHEFLIMVRNTDTVEVVWGGYGINPCHRTRTGGTWGDTTTWDINNNAYGVIVGNGSNVYRFTSISATSHYDTYMNNALSLSQTDGPPSIMLCNGVLYAFYKDNSVLDYKTSIDYGATWSDATTVESSNPRWPMVLRTAHFNYYDNGRIEYIFTIQSVGTYYNYIAPLDISNSASLIHVMNFDFGLENTTFDYSSSWGSSPYPSLVNTIVHGTGGYSYYFPANSGTNRDTFYVSQYRAASNILIGCVYMYFPDVNEAVFTADDTVFRIDVASGTNISFKMNHTTKQIYAQSSSYYANYTVTSGNWVKLDFKVDVSTGTTYIDFRVNGVAGSQATITQTATTLPYYSLMTQYLSKYYDDIVISNDADDYPLGGDAPVYTANYFPYADGTHNNAANTMEDPSGNDINGTTYLAYTWVDDVPPWTQGWGNTDYIKQTTIGSDKYVEVKFTPTTLPDGWILGAGAYVAGFSSSNNAVGDAWGGTVIRDGYGVESEIWGKQGATKSYNISGATRTAVECVDTPTGGWAASKINALRCRMGYRNATGSYTPWWLSLYLTVVYQEWASSSSKSAYLKGDAQVLLPDSDVTVGSWKNEANGSVLYPSLADSSNSTYAWYNHAVVNDYFEVGLSNPVGTFSGAHTLVWIAYKKAGTQSVSLKCELRQGTSTVIASDTQTITGSVATFSKLLSSAEVASISDYADLRIRVTIMSVT
jgi:hypothetical protein